VKDKTIILPVILYGCETWSLALRKDHRLRDIKIGNRSFEHLPQFKYLGTAITNQNLIQEEIKRRLNSGNACYHSVQNFCPRAFCQKM
jgi:hypothetical protein